MYRVWKMFEVDGEITCGTNI